MLGVEMWRQGASVKTMRILNHLGSSQGGGAARHHVDNLAEGHDAVLHVWKDAIKVTW